MGTTACTEPQCLYKGDLYLYLTGCVSDNVASEFAYFHSHENSELALSICVDIILF